MAAAAAKTASIGIEGIIWLVLVVGIFYFLAIRPQQKRKKEHDGLISSLRTGDRIVTIGGIHGKVTKLTDDAVTVQIAKGTSVVLDRSAVGRREEEPETTEET